MGTETKIETEREIVVQRNRQTTVQVGGVVSEIEIQRGTYTEK